MKPDFTDFKITISTGDTNVTKFVTASRGEHVNKLNQAFIETVRDLEMLLTLNTTLEEESSKIEEKPVVVKATKEKKTKNAKDNS